MKLSHPVATKTHEKLELTVKKKKRKEKKGGREKYMSVSSVPRSTLWDLLKINIAVFTS